MSSTPTPRTIHQTWRDANVPEHWLGYQQTWREHHPDWEYRLWTDADNAEFVRSAFPEFWHVYQELPFDIQRVDSVRYLILLELGGLYADLDTECLQPFDALAATSNFAAAEEPDTHNEWAQAEHPMVSNAIMLAPPGHTLLTDVLEAIVSRGPDVFDHRGVLTSTGPAMLGAVVSEYRGRDVSILEPTSFCPFVASAEGRSGFDERRRELGDDALRAEGVMAIHHFGNSWVGTLAGELVNPDPFDVPDFVFVSRYDAPGNDITNRGRVVEQLAQACRDSDAVGFNTDGYLKASVPGPTHWSRRDDWGENEGLYLKAAVYEELVRRSPERPIRPPAG
ncbi:MAG: glycosyltransferase family 32 protein [Gaiellaceae bacterium]